MMGGLFLRSSVDREKREFLNTLWPEQKRGDRRLTKKRN